MNQKVKNIEFDADIGGYSIELRNGTTVFAKPERRWNLIGNSLHKGDTIDDSGLTAEDQRAISAELDNISKATISELVENILAKVENSEVAVEICKGFSIESASADSSDAYQIVSEDGRNLIPVNKVGDLSRFLEKDIDQLDLLALSLSLK